MQKYVNQFSIKIEKSGFKNLLKKNKKKFTEVKFTDVKIKQQKKKRFHVAI